MVSKDTMMALMLVGLFTTYKEEDKEVMDSIRDMRVGMANSLADGKLKSRELEAIVFVLKDIPLILSEAKKELNKIIEEIKSGGTKDTECYVH